METRERLRPWGVIIPILLAAVGNLGAEGRITISSPRVLLEPEPIALALNPSGSMPAPLWSGTDWISVWNDLRPHGGAYAQRVRNDGSVVFNLNPRLHAAPPRSLVPFGAGYIVGTSSGAVLTDHELQVIENRPEIPRNLVSNGRTVFAFDDALEQTMILGSGSTTPITSSYFSGESPPKGAVSAAGDDTFLAAWLSGDSSQPDEVWINVIRTSGEAVLEQPVRIFTSPSRTLRVDAAWDGEHYLLAWTVADSTLRKVWTTLIDESGAATEPRNIWSGALAAFQLVTVAPERVLMVWPEDAPGLNEDRLRGVLFREGELLPGAIIVSDRAGVVGSDGSGSIAIVSFRDTAIRLSEIDTSGPLEKGSISHTTDWIGLRYGPESRTGIKISDGGSLAIWAESGESWGVPLTLGRFRQDPLRLEPVTYVTDSTLGYDLAESGGRNLVVYANGDVVGRLAGPDGEWLGPPVAIGSGIEPLVRAHGDGWMVVWRNFEEGADLLSYRLLGSDGIPVGPERRLPPPLIAGERILELQKYPDYVELSQGEGLLVWQEGDFQGICEFICLENPAAAIVRTIHLRDGIADSSTLRTYQKTGPSLGRPVIARAGDELLLSWIEQQTFNESDSEVMGMMLDLEGEPLGDPFVIGEGPDALSDAPGCSITAVDDQFLIVWHVYEEGDQIGQFLQEIRGAVIRPGSPGQPEIESFSISELAVDARYIELLPGGPASALLLYGREMQEYPYGGSWQIVSRVIRLDTPDRRHTIRRR